MAFTKGMAVEIFKVWAASPRGPLREWFKGYEVISADDKVVKVRNVNNDHESNWPVHVVRPLIDGGDMLSHQPPYAYEK